MLPPFSELAALPDPPLDELALALAGAFREVDAEAALEELDGLGAEVAARLDAAEGSAEVQVRACVEVLAGAHGFTGDDETYDSPDNSMLDVVLQRRRGLPILLSVVYLEVGRRAGVPLAGLGLPGHFVVGHLGGATPLVIDPFADGKRLVEDVAPGWLDPWPAPAIAMRMLNNLIATYQRRGDLGATLRAAEMRLALPADQHRAAQEVALRSLRARLN